MITAAVMRPLQLCVLLLGCTVFLPTFARGEENSIRIWPEKPVVEFGDSVVVNCSSSCEVGGLETSLKSVLVGTGTTGNSWKAFNLTNVDQWAVNALCYAHCTGGTRKLLRSNFTIYRVPEHVVMDPVPTMEVGKEYNLTCRVSSVAPIQKLIVTWFKGGKTLLVKTFENHTDPEAKEVVVPHVITVQKEDQGEEITCQAALDLRPEGPLFEKTSPSESLAPVVPPEKVFIELVKSSPSQGLHQAYNLTCRVINITPVPNLMVTLLKGAERVHSWRVQNYTSPGPESFNVTHTVALRPHDHGQEALCHVILDLSTEEQTRIATSSKLELKTPETYRGVIVASSAIGMLVIMLLGIFIYYLVLEHGSPEE